MNEADIIKAMLKIKKMSQEDLAREAGYVSQSNITGILNRSKKGIRADNLCKMLTAMNCELVIRDKDSGTEFIVDR